MHNKSLPGGVAVVRAIVEGVAGVGAPRRKVLRPVPPAGAGAHVVVLAGIDVGAVARAPQPHVERGHRIPPGLGIGHGDVLPDARPVGLVLGEAVRPGAAAVEGAVPGPGGVCCVLKG